MTNFSSFVIFANKRNRHAIISDTQPQLQTTFHSVKILNINFVLCIG